MSVALSTADAAQSLDLAGPAAAQPVARRVESVQLTMSHLGLGNLNEYALMVLFGNAHSQQLVAGTGQRPDGLVDTRGQQLYPAYFMTHLQVPARRLLRRHLLWDEVDVGVEVQRFGDTLLSSSYALGCKGELGGEGGDWSPELFPSMRGANLIVVDTVEGGGTSHRQVSAPRQGHIAALPRLRAVPPAVVGARKVRTEGLQARFQDGVPLRSRQALRHVVRPGLDAAPGHAMIFAKFSELMDMAEQQLLGGAIAQDLTLGLPLAALGHLAVRERETYYFGNCFGGEEIEIRCHGQLRLLRPTEVDEDSNTIPAAELELCFEITRIPDQALLAIARANKWLAVPVKDQDLVRDVMRRMSGR